MGSIARLVLFGSAGLLVLGLLASSAQAAEWDQAKVTEIAEKLSDAVNHAYRDIARTSTGSQIGSGQSSRALRLKDRVRVARNESRHLDWKGSGSTPSSQRLNTRAFASNVPSSPPTTELRLNVRSTIARRTCASLSCSCSPGSCRWIA